MVQKSNKSTNQWKEECYFIALTMLILAGIIMDVASKKAHPLFSITNYESICVTVISVQATISTMVFTILSFMVNKMDLSYLGVSVNNFLLQIKPHFFKQKRIIRIEIMLASAGIFCLIFRFYNTIISIFVVSMLLVMISVNGVYDIFLGTERINEEIKKYLSTDNEQNELTFEKMSDLCNQWKKEMDLQTETEFQEYSYNFGMLFRYLFGSEEYRKQLLSMSENLCRGMLRSENRKCVLHGMMFMGDTYAYVSRYIGEHDEQIKLFQTGYDLLDGVLYDLVLAIRNTGISEIEKVVRWPDFCDIVIFDSLMLKGAREENNIRDLSAVRTLCTCLGNYVAQNSNHIRKEDWVETFRSYGMRYKASYSEAKLTQQAQKATSDCFFCFLLEQVRCGYYDLVTWRYQKSLHFVQRSDDEEIRSVIKLQCYIYYLAFYETESHANSSVIAAAQSFIKSADGTDRFKEFILEIAGNDDGILENVNVGKLMHHVFDITLMDRLCSELEQWEFCAPDTVKTFVMQNAVADFVLFLSCFIGHSIHNYNILENVIPESRASSFYMRYIQKNCEEKMKRFFLLMWGKDEAEVICSVPETEGSSTAAPYVISRVHAAYSALVDAIEKKYKMAAMHSAQSGHNLTNDEIKEQTDQGSEELLSFLKNSFSGLINEKTVVDSDPNVCYKEDYNRCDLLRCCVPYDEPIRQLIRKLAYDYILVQIVSSIINRLREENSVDEVLKSSFSDQAWIRFLKARRDDIPIGSMEAFFLKDWDDRHEVREWIDKAEHYTYDIAGNALLVHKGKLLLDFKNATIKIKLETVQEAIENGHAEWVSEKEMYRYEPSANMPVYFTEDELQQYLQDNQRIIDVSVEVGIKTLAGRGQKIGTAIITR